MSDDKKPNPLAGLPGYKDPDEPEVEQEQQPVNAQDGPPTHFAIDVRTVFDLRKLLGKDHDYDDVAGLIAGLEAGQRAPLILDPPK